jgi:uncharacterized protein
MMPLMPKSTAVWLIDNTSLTFQQIANFCGLHILEIQALADDSISKVAPFDPTKHGQLTKEEITRCEADPLAQLQTAQSMVERLRTGPKYMPRSKRQERPNGILWILKEYPDIQTSKICKLLGTTKSTVESIRNKSYKSYSTLKPQDPIKLGLCSQVEFETLLGTTITHKDSQ